MRFVMSKAAGATAANPHRNQFGRSLHPGSETGQTEYRVTTKKFLTLFPIVKIPLHLSGSSGSPDQSPTYPGQC
jgi:hypothetical protein